jgi:hypothetical protein
MGLHLKDFVSKVERREVGRKFMLSLLLNLERDPKQQTFMGDIGNWLTSLE